MVFTGDLHQLGSRNVVDLAWLQPASILMGRAH